MDLHTLEAMEQIKQLQARYCRLLDQKKWEEWQQFWVSEKVEEARGIKLRSSCA